jgi:hypothetical protein
MSVVTPPVGLNLFAVATWLPNQLVTTVFK